MFVHDDWSLNEYSDAKVLCDKITCVCFRITGSTLMMFKETNDSPNLIVLYLCSSTTNITLVVFIWKLGCRSFVESDMMIMCGLRCE